jgi:hypothetical protein
VKYADGEMERLGETSPTYIIASWLIWQPELSTASSFNFCLDSGQLH